MLEDRLGLSFPVGPRPSSILAAGGRLRAWRRRRFSSSSSSTRLSSAYIDNRGQGKYGLLATREKRGDDSDREVVRRDKRLEGVQREEKGGGEGRYMRMS